MSFHFYNTKRRTVVSEVAERIHKHLILENYDLKMRKMK